MKRFSLKEYTVLCEAWIILHLMKVIIIIVPFRKIAEKIGRIHKETISIEIVSTDLDLVWRSIHRAIRFTIYKSVCYDQALTAMVMLKKRNLSSTMYLGLAKDENNQLIAHAWVRCGNKIVTGKSGKERYTVVAFFS